MNSQTAMKENSSSYLIKALALTFIGVCLTAISAKAQTLYWTTASGLWKNSPNDATTWSTTSSGSPSVVWNDGDNASIEYSNPTIGIYATPTVDTLTVTNGLTLTTPVGGNRLLDITGGGSGDITLAGAYGSGSLLLQMNGTTAWNGKLQANSINSTLNAVILYNNTATGTSTSVNLNGGTLYLETSLIGKTATIGELSGVAGSAITTRNSNGSVPDYSTRGLKVEQTSHTTYAGVIQGSNSTGGRYVDFYKDGSGRLRLNGDNTYAGTTTIEGGTLLINGTTSGQGNYSVESGATLAGDGIIGLGADKTVMIQSGGILNPGDISDAGVQTAGTLTISGATSGAGLIFEGNASLLFHLDPVDSDLIVLTGSTMSGSALGGANSLAFTFTADDYHALEGNTFDLIQFGMTPGIALGSYTLSNDLLLQGWDADFQYNGNTLQVSIQSIPEPSAILLSGLALILVAGTFIRRQQKNS